MRTNSHKTARALLGILGTCTILLSACGSSGAKATPTFSVDAIFTSAAQTFAVQQATELALTPPTDTPSPTPFPTLPPVSPLPTISSFSSAVAPTLASGGSACDNAVFVSDVTIPDGTVLEPGQHFVKTWLLQNNGTCPWTPGYKMTFLDGNNMGGSNTFVNIQVPVGQQLKMSVNLVAPGSDGSFYGRWQLQNEASQPFGSIVTVVIKVATASTAVPTNTP